MSWIEKTKVKKWELESEKNIKYSMHALRILNYGYFQKKICGY